MKALLAISVVVNIVLIGLAIYQDSFVGMGRGHDQQVETTTQVLNDSLKAEIVMFGNSITHGGGWDTLLADFTVVKRGYPGFTTSHFRWLVRKKVLSHQPEVVFLMGGINDLGVGVPMERIRENFRSLVDTLRNREVHVVLQSTLFQGEGHSSGDKVREINQYLTELAAQDGVDYLDVNAVLSRHGVLQEQFTSDGTHLTAEGYEQWSKLIYKHLKRADLL